MITTSLVRGSEVDYARYGNGPGSPAAPSGRRLVAHYPETLRRHVQWIGLG